MVTPLQQGTRMPPVAAAQAYMGGAQKGEAPPERAEITTLTKFEENRIDPMLIPRPAAHSRNEQLAQPGGPKTPPDSGGAAVSSLEVCTLIEEEDSTPRFVKQSMNLVPQTRALLTNSKTPFTLTVVPFPTLGSRECPVPKVDLSPYSPVFTQRQGVIMPPTWGLTPEDLPMRPGPIRCPACGAYICGFSQFAVRSTSCHICGHTYDLPEWYALLLEEHRKQVPSESVFRKTLNSLDHLGSGLNLLEQPVIRTELLKGTVDFLTHSHFLQNRRGNSIIKPCYQLGAGFDEGLAPPLAVPCIVYVLDITHNFAAAGLPAMILNFLKYVSQSWPAGALVDLCVILVADEIYMTGYDTQQKKLSSVNVIADVANPFLPGDPNQFMIRVPTGVAESPALQDLNAYIDALVQLMQHSLSSVPSPSAVYSAILSATAVAVELIEQRNHLDACRQSYKQPQESDMPARIYGRGGLVQVVSGSRPHIGLAAMPESPATMKHAEEQSQKSSTLSWPARKEWTVFEPHPSLQGDVEKIVKAAVLASASVTVFVIDATVGDEDSSKMALGLYNGIVRQTGGQLYYYPSYTHASDYEKLYMDFQSEVGSGVALDVSFKVRFSKGVKATHIKCPWTCLSSETGGYGSDVTAFTVPRLHHHVVLSFDLDYSVDELPGKCTYIQAAFAYTDLFGRRCLRLVNRKFLTTSTLSTAFRMSDLEPVLVSLVRSVILAMMSGEKSATKIREETDKKLTDLLLAYRLHAATTSAYGQLILPEAFKMLPIYATALFKTACTRTTSLMADARVLSCVQLLNYPIVAMLKALYPMLYPVHRSIRPVRGEQLERVGMCTEVKDEVSQIQYFFLPATVSTSGERVHSDSIYILDDGHQYLIYVGPDVKPEITALFQAARQQPSAKPLLPPCTAAQQQDVNNLLRRLWCCLAQLRVESGTAIYQPARLIFAGSVAEAEFVWKMAEDRLSAEKGYIDYLVDLHRNVQKELADI